MNPFAIRAEHAVSAVGETKLIALIQQWLGAASPASPFGIGDDCAVLKPSRRRQLITVDPVVYGRHFDDRVPPAWVGAKLVKRNLSDLAAMGGRPTAAVVALMIDRRTSLSWLEKFYRGLSACARRFDVAVVGGDITQTDGVVAASLTLLGEVTGPRVLTRQGAQVGDAIYVTGMLGGSLSLEHHFRFSPRLAEGSWLARHPAVRSMLDVSDGLAKDILPLTPEFAIAHLSPRSLPCRRDVGIREALTDGEDYELVFTLARNADQPAFERSWRRTFPRTRLSRIGHFVREGTPPGDAINLADYRGFEHLR